MNNFNMTDKLIDAAFESLLGPKWLVSVRPYEEAMGDTTLDVSFGVSINRSQKMNMASKLSNDFNEVVRLLQKKVVARLEETPHFRELERIHHEMRDDWDAERIRLEDEIEKLRKYETHYKMAMKLRHGEPTVDEPLKG